MDGCIAALAVQIVNLFDVLRPAGTQTPVYVTVRQARSLLPGGIQASKEVVQAVNTFLDELVIRFCAELPIPVTRAGMRATSLRLFMPGPLQEACIQACNADSFSAPGRSRKSDIIERMFGCWVPYTATATTNSSVVDLGNVMRGEVDNSTLYAAAAGTDEVASDSKGPLNGVELCSLFRHQARRSFLLRRRANVVRDIAGLPMGKRRRRAYAELLALLGGIIRQVARRLAAELGLHAQRRDRRMVGVRDLLSLLESDPQLESVFRFMQLRDDLRVRGLTATDSESDASCSDDDTASGGVGSSVVSSCYCRHHLRRR